MFTWALRDKYFTLHSASDTLNNDLFISQRSRLCGWEVSALQLLLIDLYLHTVRSLLLPLSMCQWSTVTDMHHQQHWQVKKSYDSLMNPPRSRVWIAHPANMRVDESKSAVVWFCIWFGLIHSHTALLACYTTLYICREGLKPTYTQLPDPSFTRPTWTVSLLLWDLL